MPQTNKSPEPLVGGNGANDLAGGSISPTTSAGSTTSQAISARRAWRGRRAAMLTRKSRRCPHCGGEL
jgi:hypothetical protein